jgi:hypothetical protein
VSCAIGEAGRNCLPCSEVRMTASALHELTL